jgi:RHS repeat-associated protein
MAIPTALVKALAQDRHACCGESTGAGNETQAPVLDIGNTTGTAAPTPIVRHTPIFSKPAEGPVFALGLNLGYRYEGGNKGKTRHMGNFSFNYENFVELQTDELWHYRDENGAGPRWIGPYWSQYLGLGTNYMEIRASDYSWVYEFGFSGETNVFGTNIMLRNRRENAHGGMEPSCMTRHFGGCSDDAPELPRPPSGPSILSEGFEFEPVDKEGDGAINFYRLKRIIAADGKAMSLLYASPTNGMIASMVDACSNVYSFAYNDSGILTNVLDVGAGRRAVFQYTNFNGGAYLSHVVDTGGQVSRYGYEIDPGNTNLMRLRSMDRPNLTGFDTTVITYDGITNTTVHLPLGHTYSMRQSADGAEVYDERAGLGSWTRAYVEDFAYSWHEKSTDGTQESLTGPDGQVHEFIWHDSGELDNPVDRRIRQETMPDGTVRHYEWDACGNLTSMIRKEAGGAVISEVTNRIAYFENTWRPSEYIREWKAPDGGVVGRSQKTYVRYEGPTTNAFDDRIALASERRWTAEDDYQETIYLYDTNNFVLTEVKELVSGTNEYRSAQLFGYDAYDRLAWEWRAGGKTNSYSYDSRGRLASVTQTNSGTAVSTFYHYDDLDRLTNMIHPDGTQESWTCAPCGCGWLTHTDRGGNISSNYFNANKWIWKTATVSSNGTLLAYRENYFNNAHSPTGTVDALGNRSHTSYDASGRVIAQTDPLGRETGFFYDAAGRQRMTVYPDGTYSSNTYNTAGWVINSTTYSSNHVALTWTDYTHDTLGRVITSTDALGNVTSTTYDWAGRIIRVDYPDGAYSRATHDKHGNVILRIGPVGSPGEESGATVSNAYDTVNRLVAATDPEGRVTRYIYSEDWPSQVRHVVNNNGQTNQTSHYAIDTGRLLTNIVNGFMTVHEYDALGQVVTTIFGDGSRVENSYDGTRLVSARSRTGNLTTYAYDALGRRTAVTNSLGNATFHAYDPVGNTTNVTDALGNRTQYAYDVMNRLSVTALADGRGSTNTYDALGRLTAKTGAGSVPASYQYDLLGRMTGLTDGENNQTGFEYDSMGRLVKKTYADGSFYGYRYYSPGMGRWVNRDPIGEGGGWNLYATVMNAPLRHVDALGRSAKSDCDAAKERAMSSMAKYIDAMKAKPCPVPKLECRGRRDKFCRKGTACGYQINGVVVACYNNCSFGFLETFQHEIMHAYDECCLGHPVNETPEGGIDCDQWACAEIRAAAFDCNNPFERWRWDPFRETYEGCVRNMATAGLQVHAACRAKASEAVARMYSRCAIDQGGGLPGPVPWPLPPKPQKDEISIDDY